MSTQTLIYELTTGIAFPHEQDTPLPEGFTLEPRPSDEHVWSGSAWVHSPEEHERLLQECKSEAKQAIHAAYSEILGRFQIRLAGYKDKERLAEVWKAQSFAEPVPDLIAKETEVRKLTDPNITPVILAHGILAASEHMRQALRALEIEWQYGSLIPGTTTAEVEANKTASLLRVATIGQSLGDIA